MTHQIESMPVDLIDPHPHNPRRILGDLTGLAASIREAGVLQNLTLVPQPDNPDRYWPVMGHRRHAAAQLAELEDVPAVIREDIPLGDQIAMMIAENVHRDEISAVEEAAGYQDMLDQGLKVAAIVQKTGRNERTVTARIRLNKLPVDAREKVHSHEATLEDAAKLDAFVRHPKIMEKLVKALGTSNFRWAIEDAQHDLKTAQAKKEIHAALKKAGIPHKPGGDGYAYNDWRPVATLVRGTDVAKAIAGGVDPAWVWIDNYSGVAILRPTLDAEKVAPSDYDHQRERELDKQAEEEGRQAYALRDEWIRGFMGRARIAAKDTLLILGVAAPIITFTNGSAYWELSEWLADTRNEDGTRKDVAERFEAEFPNVEPAAILVLNLHLQARKRTGWRFAWQHPLTVALYGLLEQLGYPVSDAERARLTPPDEPDDEDGE
jgi:ParB family chromosome partitioning protein